MKTKEKRGRPRLPADQRTVWVGGRLSPEAFRLLQNGLKYSGLSTGKLLSQIIIEQSNNKREQ